MARLSRIVVPGIPHHVTQRGNRRQRVFFSDDDYRAYLEYLCEGCRKAGTEILAYCLMPNHVHLLLVPNHGDGLRAAIAEAHRRYTRMVNFRMGWKGHLWQERFASFPADDAHALAAARYIELNPVGAGLAERPERYPWSSAGAHVSGEPDGVVNPFPLLSRVPDWPAFLRSAPDPELADALRSHENTGRPLGGESFVRAVERSLGRIVSRRKPGRKAKPGENSFPDAEFSPIVRT